MRALICDDCGKELPAMYTQVLIKHRFIGSVERDLCPACTKKLEESFGERKLKYHKTILEQSKAERLKEAKELVNKIFNPEDDDYWLD